MVNIVPFCMNIAIINLSFNNNNREAVGLKILTTTTNTKRNHNCNISNYRQTFAPSHLFLIRSAHHHQSPTNSNGMMMRRRRRRQETETSRLMIPPGGGGKKQEQSSADAGTNASTCNKFNALKYRDTRLLSSPSYSSSSASSSKLFWWRKDKRSLSVFGVLAASFLSLLGFTMVAGPLTPALGKHFQLEVGPMFGALTSAYPLGMLAGICIWPSLSDRVGRKSILSFSLFGSGLGLMTQSLVVLKGGTLSQFLLARTMTGLFAGSSPVSKAYLADIGTKDGKLGRYLSLKDASSSCAFILGPALGGVVFDCRRKMIGAAAELSKAEVLDTSGSLAFVIAVSSVASMLASLLAGLLVEESSSISKNNNQSSSSSKPKTSDDDDIVPAKTDNGSNNIPDVAVEDEELISCPLGQNLWTGVASVCIVSFLFNVGDSTFHAFFSAFLRNQGILTKDIGLLFTCLACVSFLVSTTLSSKILSWIGPVLTCASGLTLTGSSLLLLGLAASGSILGATPSFALLTAIAGIYFCGVSLYGPTIPTMLLRCVPSNRRGFILGVDGTINTLARISSPIFIGDIYRRYDASTAFVTAGYAVVSGAVIALARRFIVTLRERNATN